MGRKKNVLIVDDDFDFGDSIADILENEDCTTVTVDSGEKAVEAAKIKAFDIVLMDIKMPGIGGVEALKKIKQLNPPTHIFVMTGFSVVDVIKKAMEEGAEKVVYKPFDVDSFIRLINSF